MKNQIRLINLFQKVDKKLKKIEYRLPFIKIPTFVPRTDNTDANFFDSLLNTQVGKQYRNQEFVGINTLAASPHTLDMMEYQGNLIPSQLIIWWFENTDSGPQRCNILDLARKDNESIRSCTKMIADQIYDAIQIMYEYYKDSIHQNLHIYGMIGHADHYTRNRYGLSRGCQSAPDGHFHVTYIDEATIQKNLINKIPTPDELLKHIGIFNEIFYIYNNNIITNLIRKSTGHNAKFIRDIICEPNQVSFTHKISIYYTDPIPIRDVLFELINMVGLFSDIYDISLRKNIEYHTSKKQIRNSIKQEIIRSVIEKINYIHQDIHDSELIHIATNLTEFALYFKPTYRQILTYYKNHTLKEKIRITKQKFKKKELKIKNKLIQKYKLSEIMVDSYLKLLSERFSDNLPVNNINSGTFSLAVEFKEISAINRHIFIKNLNLYPRFGTSKGVLEDEKKVIFSR